MAVRYPIVPQMTNPTEDHTDRIVHVATGKRGSAPGELKVATGVAIDEATYQIFVANRHNNRVEVFSEMGEYLYQLGVGQLSRPCGIAIHGDSVYVSCWDNTVSRFSLTDMSLVGKIGGRGSNNGRFDYPWQLTTDPKGRVFVSDYRNHRICVFDTNLNHLHNITHKSISYPVCVKTSRDQLYVLCRYSNPCMHVLTLEGDKVRSLITRGKGIDVSRLISFCFDPFNNFIISDLSVDSILVFSPEGNLLHTIGREGHQPGMLYCPRGVATTPNGRLLCVSENMYCGLQIF